MTPQAPLFMLRDQVPAYIEGKFGVSCSKATLTRLACVGGGPSFRKIGKRVIYAPEDVDAWMMGRMSPPLAKASDLGAAGRAA